MEAGERTEKIHKGLFCKNKIANRDILVKGVPGKARGLSYLPVPVANIEPGTNEALRKYSSAELSGLSDLS